MLFDNRIKRKNVLALNEKVAAIREYEKMPVYKRIGRMFHCSPDQIKRIVQQKESILKAWEQRTRRCHDAKKLELKVFRASMLGKAVFEWVQRMMYYKDLTITDGLIQKMALQFKSAMGLNNFFPHQEWCDKFRMRYKIFENDSKLLNIGYSQGHSVQIKDIIKDILSDCNKSDNEDENQQGKIKNVPQKELNRKSYMDKISNKTSIPSGDLLNLQSSHKSENHLLRQIVALPVQTNSTGLTQKVLVATPLQTSKTLSSSSPMTMTIIPLTTISQAQSSEKVFMPPPILDIKEEIKQEPEEINIKQECVSDDESRENESEAYTNNENSFFCNINLSDQGELSNKTLNSNDLPNVSIKSARNKSKKCDSNEANAIETEKNDSISVPLPPQSLQTTEGTAGRTLRKRKQECTLDSNLPAIKNCREARQYLKLIEDFALVRENFRLIGLITRADEVLRELHDSDDIDND
ncbi:uncharacterized protein LOC119674673 isoform X2 [Teleopsis dalmanni]|nr:uncharacterized protein LOC119674673 isoform X2 [Teleopsis dalmanni]XP_037941770.1 uncharacterized protein LOC119674673 isoform X2 [Teleopsis dalmanni]XP_037941775.1 uncharacterized protein LOC119674673 isoform X2 [Teleopsis dalmanni]